MDLLDYYWLLYSVMKFFASMIKIYLLYNKIVYKTYM
jgi:hypothetical protein